MDYEIIVIGGGTGGYVAAIHAAQSGKKVCLIENMHVGGVCLNKGCIPTKTLLKSAEKWLDMKHCTDFGLSADNINFDFAKVMQRKEDIITQMRGGIAQLLKGNKVEVLEGHAVLEDAHTVTVGEQRLTATDIIVATGSRPMKPPIPGIELPGVIDSDDLLRIEAVPKSMLVIGAGVVGIEFACVFAAFGCAVSVVEMAPNILPSVDTDLTKRLGVLLRKQGIKITTGAKVMSIEQAPDGLRVAFESRGKVENIIVEKVLVAGGRIPNVQGLGLENAGVEFDKYGIKVDEYLRTNIPNIYAVGDVTNKMMLAHVASTQGMAATDNILGKPSAMSYEVVPSCIFTLPEIAMVGLTEQQAVAQGIQVVCSKFNFAGNGKAVSMGETDGLVKIVAAADTHKVLGMHIFGAHAADLIMEGTLAVQYQMTAEQLAHTIHPHPTLSEVVLETAHGVFGDIVHQVKVNR